METLFRFLLNRPVEARQPEDDAIVARPSRDVLNDVVRALGADNPAGALRDLAGRIAARATPPSDRESAYIEASTTFVAAAADGTAATPEDARDAIESAFGAPVAALVADDVFEGLERGTVDQLVGVKYGGRLDPRLPALEGVVRTAAYVRLLATDGDSELPEPPEFMRRVIVLDGLRRPARPRDSGQQGQLPDDGVREWKALSLERERLDEERVAIEATVRGLSMLPSDRLLAVPSPDGDPAADQRIDRGASDVRAGEPGRMGMAISTARPGSTRVAMAPDVLEHLAPEAREVFRRFVPEADRGDLVVSLRRLDDGLRQVGTRTAEIDALLAPSTTALVIGGGVYSTTSWSTRAARREGEGEPGVPLTHGKVESVGIGDLLVVKQHLKGYEARELSHVDNVLKSEHKSTSTKRTRTTEEIVVDERESTTEEERDQQSTERFEMQKESTKVQKEDESLKIGASLSGSYGPMVEFKVTTDLGMSSSKEESHKSAETYGKDVTVRASSKVTERVRRQVTTRTLESFEEENVHEWNNVDGDDHVVGQYQWIEKLYEAQVFNYGSRVLFDLVVPEPAAFIHYTMRSQPVAGAEITKPAPFTLDSDDINIGNYAAHAQRYNAEGIDAPPEATITIAKVFEGIDDDADRGSIVKTAEVPIPDGYEAIHARVQIASTYWEPNYRVAFSIGTRQWVHAGASTGWNQTPLDKQQRSITSTILTFRINIVAAAVEVTCNRTARALDHWRIRTHQAIKAGYLKQLKEYEDRLEAAKAQAVMQVRPRNPQLNASLQRDELKRAAISVFTAQFFDSFNSIQSGGMGLPQLDLAEASLEGPYIRFFEQAFEWQQMMYVYYPYFWGRKSRWVELSLLEDADLEFAAFMKAGAARLVVSVRPGFELAVQHFLETGQIWEGGDPPPVTSETYLNIVDEIKELQNAPGDEVPVGNPWEVRVPTTLILLRKKDSLPRWKKEPDGTWVDAT
jgi:hypothetical protein